MKIAHHLTAIASAQRKCVGSLEECFKFSARPGVEQNGLRPASAGAQHIAIGKPAAGDNTLEIASWLAKNEKVAWVNYAGLPNDKHHALHKKYAPKGAGAVFTFGLKGGYDAGVKLVSNAKLFSHVANIGDTRSLIIHPSSTTHSQLTQEQQIKAGAGPDVVRLSIGIEDAKDLIADLEQALA